MFQMLQAGATGYVIKRAPAEDVIHAVKRAALGESVLHPSVAKLLIKDAATKTSNLRELYRALADHIDSEEERRDFLASLPG